MLHLYQQLQSSMSPHHIRNSSQSASNLTTASQQIRCKNVMGNLQPIAICFFGFLHSGEVVAPYQLEFDPKVTLRYSRICVDNKLNLSVIQVKIKASKTDLFIREYRSICMGVTGKQLCPSCAWLCYNWDTIACPLPASPLLHGGEGNSPLYKWQDS